MIFIARNTTDVHIESDNAAQDHNTFYDTTGVNFIAGSIVADLDIRNNRPYSAIFGTPDGTVSRPGYGHQANPSEGTTRGKLEGIGTATAILHCDGLSEIQLGTTITSATTIDTFSGLKKGQIFVLWNYQVGFPVVIKSSVDTGNLLTNGLRDIEFTDFGQCVTFWVNDFGRAVEIGRNFKTELSGTATITGTATSILVPFSVDEPDFNYRIFATAASGGTAAAASKGSVYVSGRNLNNFSLSVATAPGAGLTVLIDWMITRNY
jgi:hypothetical protein